MPERDVQNMLRDGGKVSPGSATVLSSLKTRTAQNTTLWDLRVFQESAEPLVVKVQAPLETGAFLHESNNLLMVYDETRRFTATVPGPTVPLLLQLVRAQKLPKVYVLAERAERDGQVGVLFRVDKAMEHPGW